MYAIRGAVDVKNNTEEDILKASARLFKEIIEKNNLSENDLVSIISSATADLNKAYPGKALRQLGYTNTPILCLQEMQVEGSSRKMIRFLIHADGKVDKSKVQHQYLGKAKNLRPDLADK
ncbi:MAG: chorismate mutase [Bacillota bacterium]